MKKQIIGLFTLFTLLSAQSNRATMTMYKDGFALVKQPVIWTLELGENTISWDLLPSEMIKDSPFLTLDNAEIKMQRLNQDVFQFSKHIHNYLGETIDVELTNGSSLTGTLVEVNNSTITITRRRSIISFKKDRIDYITLPGKLENVMFKPSLVWTIDPEKRLGPVKGDLTYLSRGFDWDAIYRLILDESGAKAELLAEAYVKNNSNLDFKNLSLQLVEGKMNQNGHINTPSTLGRSLAIEDDKNAPQGELLGDYHIYTLKGKLSLMGGESITARLYPPKKVSFQKTYLFENDEQSQTDEPLGIEYRVANTESNSLGVPLPQGKIQLYQMRQGGSIEYVGEDKIRQVPKGATATIISGKAFDVMGKRTILNYDRQRKSEEGSIRIEVINTLNTSIKVRIIEHIYGDWVVRDASSNYLKKDASTIHFPLTIAGNASQTVTYTYRKEWN